jgi:hypothetical protein
MATNGKVCLDSSPCSHYHDEKYSHYRWCYTSQNILLRDEWDYCGAVDDCGSYRERRSPVSSQKQRQPFSLACAVQTANRLYRLLFERDNNDNNGNSRFMSLTRSSEADLANFISRYNGRYSAESQSNHFSDANFRVDSQRAIVDGEGRRWVNLQVQRNVPRDGNNPHTTVAQIYFQVNGAVPSVEQMRSALRTSYRKKKVICIYFATNRNSPCPFEDFDRLG